MNQKLKLVKDKYIYIYGLWGLFESSMEKLCVLGIGLAKLSFAIYDLNT